MMNRFALMLVAAALTACGPNAAPPAAEGPAPSEAVDAVSEGMAQSTGGPCPVAQAIADEAGLEAHGSVGGYEITATPGGLACSEPALGRVECAATGPAELHVTAQDTAAWTLEAGQSGTLVVAADGGAICYLNANGG